MSKVVINTCYGGFSLSPQAVEAYLKRTSLSEDEGTHFHCGGIPRDDPDLVAVVEDLGVEASGTFARLKVVDVPDDVAWFIMDYDGVEYVAEPHRTWG